jgi:hypothetical protein
LSFPKYGWFVDVENWTMSHMSIKGSLHKTQIDPVFADV